MKRLTFKIFACCLLSSTLAFGLSACQEPLPQTSSPDSAYSSTAETEAPSASKLVTPEGVECTLARGGTHYYVSDYVGTGTSVTIPEACQGLPVTEIGDHAFEDHPTLAEIVIPKHVTAIGRNVFNGCENLTGIEVKSGNPVYHSDGNCLIETERKTLLAGCKTSVIPDDGSVTKLGVVAFADCAGLTEIVIPDCVTELGECAFSSCKALTRVTLPDGLLTIGKMAFNGCERLTEITIPDTVTSLGFSVFGFCYGLQTVNISENSKLTAFGDLTFLLCSSLRSLRLNKGLTSIGGMSFYGCGNLESIEVESGNPVYHSDGNCLIETESKTLIVGCKNSVIPSDGSVTELGVGAFYNCQGLTEIFIPKQILTVPSGSFSFCRELESIEAESGNPVYHSDGNCLIETESKTLIVGCKNSVIPSDGSVTEIGASAFSGCTKLAEIVIPTQIRSIGSSAFDACIGLTSVVIPESVTTIPDSAFQGCTHLQTITLPKSITSIGSGAFSGCDALEKIEYLGTMEAWKKLPKPLDPWEPNKTYTVQCIDGKIE